jgi:putative hydrolase of the HAD superfamily
MYKRGKMSDDEYWSYAIKEWKLSLSVQEIIDLLIRGYETNDLAFEYVKKVRLAGYKTAICSNNFPAKISGLQKRFGFLNDFDTVVISYEVGSVKPEKEIFEKLIDKSGVQAEEIFYSDDDESKLAGAKELGIQTSVYTTFEAFVMELKTSGVKV